MYENKNISVYFKMKRLQKIYRLAYIDKNELNDNKYMCKITTTTEHLKQKNIRCSLGVRSGVR